MIEPPSSDDEGPAVDLDLPETLEALAEWCDTRMTKWANCAIKNKGAKQDIAADAAIMRAKMFKEKATSLRLKENLARIGNSSLATGKRMRTEWLETQGDEEEESRPKARLAVERGSSSLEGWEFGRLPRLKSRVPLPAELPFHLGELLRVQPALLQNLSTVKLRILAKAYRKVYPKDGYNHSEDTLYTLITTAIKTMVPGWEPAPAPLPNLPEFGGNVLLVDRDDEVAAAVGHWLKGWAAGDRGRAVNLFCHESGMGKTTLLQALGNPPESLTNAFVRGARRSGSLEALMTLLCAQTLVVHLERMPEDSESLGKAVTHALVASVDKIPGVKLGPLKRLQAGTSASFDSMLTAIQQQLATPLIVAFDQLEEIYKIGREVMFAAQLRDHKESSDHKLLRMAELFLAAVQSPLMTSPHLFYAAASQAIGPALMGKSLLPGGPSSCQTHVFVLKSITKDGIQRLLRYTSWQGDSKQQGQALYIRLGLRLDAKEFNLFCKGIHSLTAGIPALVVLAVDSSVTHRPPGGWGNLTENEMAAMLSPKVDWLTPWEAVIATSPQKGTGSSGGGGLGSGGQAGPSTLPHTPQTPPVAAQAPASPSMASPGTEAAQHTPSSAGGKSTDMSTPSTDAGHDPGITIMRRARSKQGIIAADLRQDTAAMCCFSTEHCLPLVLGHFLDLPLKIPESAHSLEDMAQLYRLTMAAATFEGADKEGMIRLVMPMVAVFQRSEVLGALLPVLKGYLMEFLRTDPLFVNTWKVMEWLWQDVVLKILMEILTKPSSGRFGLKVVFGFFEDELDVEVRLAPNQKLRAKVPAFSVSVTKMQDNDACIHELLDNPWARKIRATDFPKLFNAEPRIFPDFHVWQPGPGSAGPDLYLSAGSVLVCMSAKARMGKQPFKLEEVAKNINYIMQFGEPMVDGKYKDGIVLIEFNHKEQQVQVQELAGERVPVGTKLKLPKGAGTVVVPPWLHVYIFNEDMHRSWLGEDVAALLARIFESAQAEQAGMYHTHMSCLLEKLHAIRDQRQGA